MKVSLNWLREYVDVALPAEELARRLTEAGIEVEAIERTGGFQHVWVARIQRIEPHPNADRLTLVTADYGPGRTQRVVTGATNIKEGDVVPLGLLGTRYLDRHSDPPVDRVLEATTMRGIPSEGMVMSGFELGISDDHSGILVLPADAPVGAPFSEALGPLGGWLKERHGRDVTPGDAVIELDLKGRADCLSMIGVAREVAALTSQIVRVPVAEPAPARPRRASEPLEIEIEDADLCTRYTGVLLDQVKIGPSPEWMQARLIAAGQRPINNVVDITNFVMLEWGQPLHAFDYPSLRQGKIVVRPAREGETLLTLAEERPEIKLTPDQLVIADAERPVALAGVIGGAETEVRETTSMVLLEAANFLPPSIRRTARALLPAPTEASRRFERGIPPEHTMLAALRAAQLMVEYAGAQMVGEPVDCYPRPASRPIIRLAPTEFERLLGVDYDASTIESVFDRLGIVYEKPGVATGGMYLVQPPIWRLDIDRTADLVEEVARIDGYHRIPTTVMRGEPPVPVVNQTMFWEDTVRDVLAATGFVEIIPYSWTSQARLDRFPHAAADGAGAPGAGRGGPPGGGAALATLVDQRVGPPIEPVRIANPASRDQDVMRTSAVPSLLETLRNNLRYASHDVHLFDVGRIYLRREGDLPEERRMLSAATGAFRTGLGWNNSIENDFYFLKGILDELLARLGISGHGYVAVDHPGFHPYRAAAVVLNHRPEAAGKKPIQPEEMLGIIGEVREEAREAFDLGQRAYLFSVDLDRLIALASNVRRYVPVPETPAVVEDLAFVVKDDVPGERVIASIRRAGAPLLESLTLFDVYEGERVAEGYRSLAFTVTYRDPKRTLSTEDVAQVRAKIISQVERQTGAKLRG